MRPTTMTMTLLASLLLLGGCMSSYLGDAAQDRRTAYVENHPELTDLESERLLQGRIWMGMTREEALASWGPPSDVNRTVTPGRTSEQWVYGSPPSVVYVYFEDGILTSWQN